MVDGLPLHGGAQLLQTPHWSALYMETDDQGRVLLVALLAARKRKERRTQNSSGQGAGHASVLAVEVGGRFSLETSDFISELARARAPVRDSVDAETRRASLAAEMVRLVWLRCSEGVRSIVGDAMSSGRGWRPRLMGSGLPPCSPCF